MYKAITLSVLFFSCVESRIANKNNKFLTQTKASRDYINNPFTSSLADCQDFASVFDNTCDTSLEYDTLSDVPSELHSCIDVGGCDPENYWCSDTYDKVIVNGRKTWTLDT